MLYTVGDAAKKMGLTPSTLRYYDKEGLLPLVERSENGIRMFKDSDFEWLSTIECLKQTGMALKDIRHFMDLCLEGDASIGERLQLILKQQAAISEKMNQLQNTMKKLKYKQWYYETAQKAGTCNIHQTLSEKDIPAEFREPCHEMKTGSKAV